MENVKERAKYRKLSVFQNLTIIIVPNIVRKFQAPFRIDELFEKGDLNIIIQRLRQSIMRLHHIVDFCIRVGIVHLPSLSLRYVMVFVSNLRGFISKIGTKIEEALLGR